MSISIHKGNTNDLNENSHRKHFTKLPELKIKIKNNNYEHSPIRRNRFVPSFKSPDENRLKINIYNDNSIGRVNTFNHNLSNLKGNNDLFSSTDRELTPHINKRKTKSILKKNSLVNDDEIEHDHEHKSVKFAFDENNQPLKTVFFIDQNENNLENDKNYNGNSENINKSNKEFCKCESCLLF